MSKRYWISRDRKFRQKYPPTELNKLVLKSLIANKNLPKIDKIYWSILLHKYGKKAALSSYRRSCNETGKSRSVFKRFKASRHILKKYGSLGWIAGLRKSSF